MFRLVAACALVFLLFGCDDNGQAQDGGKRDMGPGWDAVVPTGDGGAGGTYSFLLSGDQMVPRVTTAGSGTATVTISPDQSQIDVSVLVSNLGGLTGAEIQLGEVGVHGPAIFILSTQAFVNPLQVTLRAGDLKPQPASGVANFADAIKAISTGMAYLVVKTGAGTEGELRGQMGFVTLDGQLSADQLQPPGTSSATGTIKTVVAGDQKSLEVTLTPKDLVGSTGAFIHVGGPGANGPVIFKISTQPLSGPVTVTLRAQDLTPQPSQNISTFAEAIDAVLAGLTYVVINTQTQPNGEVRGHIGRQTFSSTLTGAAMVPPVETTDTAAAQVTLPNSRKGVIVNLNAAGITGITGATINVAESGQNGPPIFVVSTATFEGSLDKVLLPTDLRLQSGNGISSFNDAIHALMVGKTYLLLTTVSHPDGFLRGQIGGY
jgi:hypothetical protein